MFKNIEIREIDRDNVRTSVWIFFLIAFLVTISLALFFSPNMEAFGEFLLYTIPVFIGFCTTVGAFCIIIESIFLGKQATTRTVSTLFLIEIFLPTTIAFIIFFRADEDQSGTLVTLIIMTLTAGVRWLLLKRKNRMYTGWTKIDKDKRTKI